MMFHPPRTPQVVLGPCICLFVSELFLALCWRLPVEAAHLSHRSQRSKPQQQLFSRILLSVRKGSDQATMLWDR
jgi:hypothetical protein